MARVVVTLRIMPESPETDLKKLEQKASEKIKAFGCEVGKTEIRPVAFGLKALLLYF
ncbi:TPA: elongation factor 1-beta, partial [Candidatus Woesearchaeota archaeon]|nr:elongation factor 1-beta [Candidatus Woesearchaeota archaeon]